MPGLQSQTDMCRKHPVLRLTEGFTRWIYHFNTDGNISKSKKVLDPTAKGDISANVSKTQPFLYNAVSAPSTINQET